MTRPYLGNPKYTIEVLQKYGFVFQKRFGQNFLIDGQVIADIVNAVAPQRAARVVEIGPGLGSLTLGLLDVAQHVLRFWESKFAQIRPLKRGGGRRYYRPEDIELLRQIRSLLYEQGYTIGGARLRLEGEGAKQESALSNQIVRQVRMELEEVLQLLRR